MTDIKPNQEMRITKQEMDLLKNTFKNNDNLIKLLRKIFLPEISPITPLGQQIDLWMTIPIDNMLPEQAMINLKARNSLIQHVEMQLLTLKTLANMEKETPAEKEERQKKDSAK